jgi:hypothetical protein
MCKRIRYILSEILIAHPIIQRANTTPNILPFTIFNIEPALPQCARDEAFCTTP